MSPRSATGSSFVSQRAQHFDSPFAQNDYSQRSTKYSIVATRIREFGQQCEPSKGSSTDGHYQPLTKEKLGTIGSKQNEIQKFLAQDRAFRGSTSSDKLLSRGGLQSQLDVSSKQVHDRTTHASSREVGTSMVSQKIRSYMNNNSSRASSEVKVWPIHHKSLSTPEAAGQTPTDGFTSLRTDYSDSASVPLHRLHDRNLAKEKEVRAALHTRKTTAKLSTTLQQPTSNHQSYTSTSVASTVHDKYNASARNNDQGLRSGNLNHTTHSAKSSIRDEISSMISSAVEGRSGSTLGSLELARPDSRLLGTVPEGPSFEAKRQVYEYASFPIKIAEPVTSSYKLSSLKPIVYPRDGSPPSRSRGADPLDGYQFSPPDSPVQFSRPASISASRGFKDSGTSRNPITTDNKPARLRRTTPEFELPVVDGRFCVFLRERAGYGESSSHRKPQITQVKHSPKNHSQSHCGSDSEGYRFEEQKAPVTPNCSPTTSPCPNHDQPAGGESLCWRWWKLVRSDREVGTQYSDENSSDEDEDAVARRGSFSNVPGMDTRGESTFSTKKGALDLGIDNPESPESIEEATGGKLVHEYTGNAGGAERERQATTTDGVMDSSQSLATETKTGGGSQTKTRPGENVTSGMQVVIRLEENSAGKVWVEVTPSPKGRKRAESMARETSRP